mmetsp:Transcript_25007/g.48863  ORF Transcript_25007/g.48863 Transcript_25007/m.48863 type:complete len:412 (+) Transcript_25007:153-1388(+)
MVECDRRCSSLAAWRRTVHGSSSSASVATCEATSISSSSASVRIPGVDAPPSSSSSTTSSQAANGLKRQLACENSAFAQLSRVAPSGDFAFSVSCSPSSHPVLATTIASRSRRPDLEGLGGSASPLFSGVASRLTGHPRAFISRYCFICCCARNTHWSIFSNSSDAISDVFSTCRPMAAKPLNVCFSHNATCSSEANLFSDIFILEYISGSLVPSCKLWPVLNRVEDELGRDPLLGLTPANPVRVKVNVLVSSSDATGSVTGSGAGLPSKSSRPSNSVTALFTSSCSADMGLPNSDSSLNNERGFRCRIKVASDSWFSDKSRISNECQLAAVARQMSATQFPERLSSASCGSFGMPSSPLLVSWFDETSSVARRGKGCGDPLKKQRVSSLLPRNDNSSILDSILMCSTATC